MLIPFGNKVNAILCALSLSHIIKIYKHPTYDLSAVLFFFLKIIFSISHSCVLYVFCVIHSYPISLQKNISICTYENLNLYTYISKNDEEFILSMSNTEVRLPASTFMGMVIGWLLKLRCLQF